jgi:murein DD-endopeptidase MepM/ murein hydrolase activator NlpD
MSRFTQRAFAVAVGVVLALVFSGTAQAKTVHVQRGDTLSGIVKRECGSSNWSRAARENAATNPNPHLIYAGQTLEINCDGAGAASPAPAPAPAAAPAPPAPPASGWVNPLPGYTNGHCNYWEWRGTYNHRGEDWPAPHGTPIRAVAAGTVSTAWQSGAGNYTVIRHDNGAASVYMHQSSFAVWSGRVSAGQIIGYVGSTGNSTGPHLHFEIQPWGPWNGVVNPVTYLRERGVVIGC